MKRRFFLATLAAIATAPIAKLLGALGGRFYRRGAYVGDGALERDVALGFRPKAAIVRPTKERSR